MLLAAELLGRHVLLFPESLALAFGKWVLCRPELVVSRWRIAVLSTVSGTIGVVVTRLPGPRWLVVVLVLTVTLALLQLTPQPARACGVGCGVGRAGGSAHRPRRAASRPTAPNCAVGVTIRAQRAGSGRTPRRSSNGPVTSGEITAPNTKTTCMDGVMMPASRPARATTSVTRPPHASMTPTELASRPGSPTARPTTVATPHLLTAIASTNSAIAPKCSGRSTRRSVCSPDTARNTGIPSTTTNWCIRAFTASARPLTWGTAAPKSSPPVSAWMPIWFATRPLSRAPASSNASRSPSRSPPIRSGAPAASAAAGGRSRRALRPAQR